MEKERQVMENKFKKLEKDKTLANRLLSDDERDLLRRRRYSQALSPDELSEIN